MQRAANYLSIGLALISIVAFLLHWHFPTVSLLALMTAVIVSAIGNLSTGDSG